MSYYNPLIKIVKHTSLSHFPTTTHSLKYDHPCQLPQVNSSLQRKPDIILRSSLLQFHMTFYFELWEDCSFTGAKSWKKFETQVTMEKREAMWSLPVSQDSLCYLGILYLAFYFFFFLKISSNMLSIFMWVMNWPESGPVI